MARWIISSLNRKLSVVLATALVLASLVFLALFVWLYQLQLEGERGQASVQVNRLLEASLENAMLNRDLDGLRTIVQRLGAQDSIRQVVITDPKGEVRFSSHAELLGREIASTSGDACAGCPADGGSAAPSTAFLANEQGDDVLRSTNPVRNKAPCVGCHGSTRENPINGVLLVDYDASPIRAQAANSALLFAGSGGLVLLMTLAGTGWLVRRNVIMPLEELAGTSRALAAGKLDARVTPRRPDEIGELGETFNDMAAELQEVIRQVRQSEALLQDLIDGIPDAIRVIDENFTIWHVNQAYCRLLGTDARQVVGMACHRSSHGRGEPCPPTLITCPIHEILHGAAPLRTLQQHVRADGEAVQVEVFAAPIRLKRDGKERILVVESIRDLTAQLEISQEQRLAEMDQLASGVAHEIHNPLASIRLALQAVLRTKGEDGERDPELYEYLVTMDHEIDSCIEITERLLRLGRLPDEQPQLISVNSAIAETLSLLAYEATDRGITVEKDLDAADPRIIASDGDLRMLVFNLAQNAFHAMPEGGELAVSSRKVEGQIEIGFRDSGVGIRASDLPHIYDPFFSRRADGVKGTGLGLTICKTIAKRHGGRIEVDSKAGEGSRFVVRLPDADFCLEATDGHGDEAERIAH